MEHPLAFSLIQLLVLGVRWIWICGPDFKSHASLSDPGIAGSVHVEEWFWNMEDPKLLKNVGDEKKGKQRWQGHQISLLTTFVMLIPRFWGIVKWQDTATNPASGFSWILSQIGRDRLEVSYHDWMSPQAMVQLETDLFLGEAQESSGYSHIAYDIAEGQRTWDGSRLKLSENVALNPRIPLN